MRVLVTGASGFVGEGIVRRLAGEAGYCVRAASRREPRLAPGVIAVHSPSLGSEGDWTDVVQEVDVVVHSAARAHVMRDDALDPLAEFRAVNVAGTLTLARQSALAGVRRFVFLSSIKVNGEETRPGRPFTEDDAPAPSDPYGMSKLEAERALREVGDATGMEVVIIRPVLVYGPGVRANFRSIMRALHRGLPLPLGAIDNRRSLVALDNLVDLIARGVSHPAAAGQTFLVSDGEDLSTTQLLHRTASALGVRARLLPVSPALLELAARAAGRTASVQRLCRSLQVDISKARGVLDWAPPVAVTDALARTAAHFLENVRE